MATATGEFAAFAGVEVENDNGFLTVGTLPGSPTSGRGSLAIADLPGIGSAAGSFAEFFSTPKDLSNATIRARVRDATGSPGIADLQGANSASTSVHFVLRDDAGNESASEELTLSDAFQTLEVNAIDFDTPIGDSLALDPSLIVGLRFEFFSGDDPATAAVLDIDDVVVRIPEPSSESMDSVALLVVAAIAFSRKHQRAARLVCERMMASRKAER